MTRIPRHAYRGADIIDTTSVLNAHLLRDGVAVSQCSSFQFRDLVALLTRLAQIASPDLNHIYKAAGDGRALRNTSAQLLAAQWAAEVTASEHENAHHGLASLTTDGLCNEAVMMWVHQLTTETRNVLRNGRDEGFVLPLLPPFANHDDARLAHPDAARAYDERTPCRTCHVGSAHEPSQWDGNWSKSWPEEFSYEAHAVGPYPFWTGGVDDAASLGPGGQIKVSYSAVRNAESFAHGSCDLNPFGYNVTGRCTNLFVGYDAYLFSPDTSFCCKSFGPGLGSQLDHNISASQRDWWRGMSYNGISQNYVGEFYAGAVHNFTYFSEYCPGRPRPGGKGSSCWFWYYTRANDSFPVEQGEGCAVMPRQSCHGFSYLYHQYNPLTLAIGPPAASTLAVPDQCQGTARTCSFPSGPHSAHSGPSHIIL